MRKTIVVCLAILLLSSVVFAGVTESQFRKVLRRSLFEHFKGVKHTLSKEEVYDLLKFYLEDRDMAELGEYIGQNSHRSIEAIINDAVNRYEYGDVCQDECGDGICSEFVCQMVGCPCPETKQSCPLDCSKGTDSLTCSEVGLRECSDDGKYLYVCGKGPGKKQLRWEHMLCLYGCELGECIQGSNENICRDTDPTNNPGVHGTCTDGEGEFSDWCNEGGYGGQYYCLNGKCESMSMDCLNCVDNTCAEEKLCSELGGYECTMDETCIGEIISGAGARCCSKPCEEPAWDLCSKCGEGLFNLCDKEECNLISEGCYFSSEWGSKCEPCSQAGCSLFSTDAMCLENPCNLGCNWDNGECVVCSDECGAGELKCSSENGYSSCGNFDEDNCMEWSQERLCEDGRICDNGGCVASVRAHGERCWNQTDCAEGLLCKSTGRYEQERYCCYENECASVASLTQQVCVGEGGYDYTHNPVSSALVCKSGEWVYNVTDCLLYGESFRCSTHEGWQAECPTGIGYMVRCAPEANGTAYCISCNP